MKAYYPEIWDRIKKAVKRGQWEPVGSMWIETDCSLASGEIARAPDPAPASAFSRRS